MKTSTILIVSLLFSAGCTGQKTIKNIKYTPVVDSTLNESIKMKEARMYFPVSLFQGNNASADRAIFKINWYSKHLAAMAEPMIYKDTCSTEAYRFTWLRTFHNPIAVRIEKQGDNYILFWKVCNGAGGYEPGKLIVSEQKNLKPSDWDSFIQRLNEIDFWNLETLTNNFGLDGSQWILEGRSSCQYHVIDRWTPDEKSKFWDCCNFLLELTDLEIPKKDKY